MSTYSNLRFQLAAALSVVATVLLVACGGGSPGSTTNTAPGNNAGNTSGTNSGPNAGTNTSVNTLAVVVDSGPTGNSINQPFVTVRVCKPGTSNCVNIDHVLLDTGSYGLRLLSSSATTSLGLVAQTNSGGQPVAECAQFASGYTFGGVRLADVKLSGETAANIPIEIIGDPAYSIAPASCTTSGANMGNLPGLGANGILGVGLFVADFGLYYGCIAGLCTDPSINLPAASQVSNPVAFFGLDSNGVTLSLPSVPSTGTSSLSGTLTFGIGTRSNNSIAGKSVYLANPNTGNFNVTFNGQSYSNSFIDSGSNGLYFPNTSNPAIPLCTSNTDFYCPPSLLNLSAINAAYDGSSSNNVFFSLLSQNSTSNTTVAAPIGGPASFFDWGLPFFFGRPVAYVIDGVQTPGGTGPYFAY